MDDPKDLMPEYVDLEGGPEPMSDEREMREQIAHYKKAAAATSRSAKDSPFSGDAIPPPFTTDDQVFTSYETSLRERGLPKIERIQGWDMMNKRLKYVLLLTKPTILPYQELYTGILN